MSTWIGPVGSLVEFRDLSALDVSPASRVTQLVTLGGRVKEQRGPRGRRVWSCSVPAATAPEQMAGLLALVDAAPAQHWVWIDPWAAVTNLCTPEACALVDGSFEGSFVRVAAQVTDDGVWLPALLSGSGGLVLGRPGAGRGVPVVPGQRFTGSVYALGSSVTVGLRWLNSAGVTISTPTVIRVGSDVGAVSRRSISATAPTGAAMAVLTVSGASLVGGPSITMTSDAVPYAHGEGAARVSVDGVSRSVVTATLRQRLASFSFTVREVG